MKSFMRKVSAAVGMAAAGVLPAVDGQARGPLACGR